MELSESFYIFLVTTTAGIFLAMIKLVYDSKCKNIKLCGLQIERDIQAERDIENHRIEHDSRQSIDRPVNENPLNNINN